MKNWLKKVKNNEIIDILEDKSSKKKIYSVPKQVDEQVKFNLKKISEEIKSEKEEKNVFFIPKLVFGFSMMFIVIIGLFLFIYPKGKILDFLSKKKLNECLVTSIDGKAYLVDDQFKNISELKVGLDIGENDIIKTENDSTVELQIGDDSLVRVKENSILKVVKLFKDQDLEKTKINLDIGKILAKPKNLTEGSSFEVETKSVTAGVRGTEFTVTKTKEGNAKIAVNEGEVRVVKNIVSEDIDEIKKIDRELAENLDGILHEEIVLRKDEKIEVNDIEFNKYKEEALNTIKTISEEIAGSKGNKEEMYQLKKEVGEKAIRNIREGSDKVIIKAKITQEEWQDDFNREEFKEMGDVVLIKEISNNKIETKKVEEKEIEDKIKVKPEEKKEVIEISQTYKNNFEKELKGMVTDNEWQIIVDNDNNHVLAPVNADINSDTFFTIKEAENFILQFRFKRFPNNDNACWMAIDLGIDRDKEFAGKENDWIIPANVEMMFGNRLNNKKYKTVKYNFDYNKWYDFKIIVRNGKQFNIYIDNKLVLTYNKLNKDMLKYNFIKFEGHPTMGKWYLDDVYYEAK